LHEDDDGKGLALDFLDSNFLLNAIVGQPEVLSAEIRNEFAGGGLDKGGNKDEGGGGGDGWRRGVGWASEVCPRAADGGRAARRSAAIDRVVFKEVPARRNPGPKVPDKPGTKPRRERCCS